MKIAITLPAYYNFPIGGYHVHYQYANLLSRKGHDVTLVFPRTLSAPNNLETRLKTGLWAIKLRTRNRPLIKTFPIDRAVKVVLASNLGAEALPNADILIATAWQTAEALEGAPPRCGRKFYIVYDYEHLMTARETVRARIERTYRGSFEIIATSKIVEETVRSCGGESTALIQCGLDFSTFGMDRPPEERSPMQIAFPLRPEQFKGASDAIAASSLLRERFGENLQISAFGSHGMTIPTWIHWCKSPSRLELRAFYNLQAIFMVPSHFEGWGLPGIEAMACGAALATTDNGGCRDYAIDGETSIVVEPGKPEKMADAVTALITDPSLRLRLSTTGQRFVQRFSWDDAADRLEAVLFGHRESQMVPQAGANWPGQNAAGHFGIGQEG